MILKTALLLSFFSSASHADYKESALQCAAQICSTPAQSATSQTLMQELLKNPEELAKANAESLRSLSGAINTLVETVNEQEQLLTDQFVVLLNKAWLDPDPRNQRLHDFIFLVSAFDRMKYKMGPSMERPVVVDVPESEKALSGTSAEERAWILESVSKFLESRAGREALLSQFLPPEQFFRNKYPGFSLSAATRQLADDASANAEKIKADPRSGNVQHAVGASRLLENKIIAQARSGAELDSNQLKQLITTAGNLDLLRTIISGPEEIITRPYPISARQYLEEGGVREKLEKYKAAEKEKETVSKLQEETAYECLKGAIFGVAVSPTPEELTRAHQLEETAREGAREVFSSVFSPTTAQKLAAVITQSHFSFPPAKKEFVSTFLARLEQERQNAVSTIEDLKKAATDEEMQRTILLDFQSYLGKLEIGQRFKDVTELCDDYKPAGASDNAFTSAGRIQTSWFTVKAPEIGRGIMLHELGHIAFHLLENDSEIPTADKERFKEIQACLAGLHGELPESDRGRYVEEDFADELAAHAQVSENINMACGLLERDDTDASLQLRSPEANGTHSEDFFRLLHTLSAQKKEMPGQCRQAVNQVDPKQNFRGCF